MSMELRWYTRGRCECGSKIIGDYTPECEHWTECDFGRLGPNAHGDPTKPLEELLLAPAHYVRELATKHLGETTPWGGTNSVTESLDGRLFAHIDYQGHRTSYELFPAHYKGEPEGSVMIGKRIND